MTLALTSETISLRAMSDIADTILAQRLSQISGVGRVAVLGGLKPAVRVQADLARLAAYGISMEDLRAAIAGANVCGPRDRSTARSRPTPSPPTTRSPPPRPTSRSSSPTATARRSPSATSPSSSTAGERPHRRLVPGHAGRHHRHPAAARRQCHRCRAPDPRGNSEGTARDPRRRQPYHRQRPHRHHPRFGARRAVHADPERGAGDVGGASVPALAARHADRRRGAAAVADHLASASCISPASASTICR